MLTDMTMVSTLIFKFKHYINANITNLVHYGTTIDLALISKNELPGIATS